MKITASFLALLLIGAAALANAREFQVRAPVIDVETLTEPGMEVQHCPDKPADGASLGDLMAWDLGLACRTERIDSDRVTGYRVFYRWDDRVHSQVMRTRPGSTIPLTVRLD